MAQYFFKGPPQMIREELESAYAKLLEAIDTLDAKRQKRALNQALRKLRIIAERHDKNTAPLEQAFIAAAKSREAVPAVLACIMFCDSFRRDKKTFQSADSMADVLLAEVQRDSKRTFLKLSRSEHEEFLRCHGVTVDAETLEEMWSNHQMPGVGRRYTKVDALQELATYYMRGYWGAPLPKLCADGAAHAAFERARDRARKPTESTRHARRLYDHK